MPLRPTVSLFACAMLLAPLMNKGLTLRLTILVASLLLAACGGSQKSSAPPEKLLSSGVQAVLATARGTTTNDPGDDEDPPQSPPASGTIHGLTAGTRYVVEAPFISQVPLRIVVGASVYAELCLYNSDPQKQLCTTIDSPLPAGMDLAYTDAAILDQNDDPRFLTFIPVVGNSDPQGLTAQRFIEALARAAAVWGNYLSSPAWS